MDREQLTLQLWKAGGCNTTALQANTPNISLSEARHQNTSWSSKVTTSEMCCNTGCLRNIHRDQHTPHTSHPSRPLLPQMQSARNMHACPPKRPCNQAQPQSTASTTTEPTAGPGSPVIEPSCHSEAVGECSCQVRSQVVAMAAKPLL